jgi:hypothetical protein
VLFTGFVGYARLSSFWGIARSAGVVKKLAPFFLCLQKKKEIFRDVPLKKRDFELQF